MTILNQSMFNNQDNAIYDSALLVISPIDTQKGDDHLVATTAQGTWYAQTFGIYNSVLITGRGDDLISGDGSAGFQSNGLQIGSFSQAAGIDTGDGEDIIIGLGSGGGAGGFGISNFSGFINTGDGDDLIVGRSQVSWMGLYNFGLIDTGSGDDEIIASGMINGGTISTGSGDDLVVSEDGSGNAGTLQLGSGDDTIKGILSGNVSGSEGMDTALLRPGTYTIDDTGNAFINNVGSSLFLSGFEKIGSLTDNVLDLHAGTLSIGTDGSADYILL